MPARMPDDVRERVRELAVATFRLTGCSGLARVDFFVDGDEVLVNELNTIPGFTPDQRVREAVRGLRRPLRGAARAARAASRSSATSASAPTGTDGRGQAGLRGRGPAGGSGRAGGARGAARAAGAAARRRRVAGGAAGGGGRGAARPAARGAGPRRRAALHRRGTGREAGLDRSCSPPAPRHGPAGPRSRRAGLWRDRFGGGPPRGRVHRGRFPEEASLEFLRVVGAAMARVAEAMRGCTARRCPAGGHRARPRAAPRRVRGVRFGLGPTCSPTCSSNTCSSRCAAT